MTRNRDPYCTVAFSVLTDIAEVLNRWLLASFVHLLLSEGTSGAEAWGAAEDDFLPYESILHSLAASRHVQLTSFALWRVIRSSVFDFDVRRSLEGFTVTDTEWI